MNVKFLGKIKTISKTNITFKFTQIIWRGCSRVGM